MPKHANLQKRKNGVYYFRSYVPTSLIFRFGRLEITRSLRTANKVEADKQATLMKSKLFRIFDMATENPSLSGPQLRVIARAYLDTALSIVRKDILSRPLLFQVHAEGPTANELMADEMTNLEATYTDAITRFNLSQGHELASELIQSHGLAVSEPSSEFNELRYLALRLLKEEASYSRALYTGQKDTWTPQDNLFLPEPKTPINENPGAVALATDKPGLSYVVKEFLKDKKNDIKPRSYEKHAYQLMIATRFFGSECKIDQIKPLKIREYRQLLQQLPANFTKHFRNLELTYIPEDPRAKKLPKMKVGAINPYLSSLSSLFEFAKQMEYVDSNPADRMALKDSERAKDKRDPFSTDHLRQIFNSPLYSGFKPSHPFKAGKSLKFGERYWLPIIALWSGMRRGEIMALKPEDIRQEDEVWIMDIQDAKTSRGIRKVPIHPFLIELGWQNFAKGKTAGRKIFDAMTGDAVGKFFTRLLRSVCLGNSRLCFHSFRHTFADAARRASIPNDIIKELVGHEDGDVTRNYGSGHAIEKLAEQMARITYPGLDLSHLLQHRHHETKTMPPQRRAARAAA